MKETGILMTPENYGKCEDGSKTQTRRIIALPTWAQKGSEIELDDQPYAISERSGCSSAIKCPFGTVGDRLYVKEAVEESFDGAIQYRRDKALVPMSNWAWKVKVLSGRFMPKGLARLWLELTEVRVERIQEISLLDVGAEGYAVSVDGGSPKDFAQPWNRIHGEGAWERNDWVWVLSFSKVQP